MRHAFLCLLIGVLTIGVVGDASAYVGPGAGLSLVGAFWGLAVAVFAALSFIILWPLRRMFRKAGGRRADEPATAGEMEARDRAS